MWKQLKNEFKPYMFRPIIYQAFTKSVIGILICFLWDRFVNGDHLRNIYEQAFFTMGVLFLILAWIQYLRMDGVKIHHLFENRKNKKKSKHHWQRDIIDYADEKIISFEQLEEEEKTICRFLSNLICVFIFFIPCLIHSLF